MKNGKYKIPLYGGTMRITFYDKATEKDMMIKYNINDLPNYNAVTIEKNNASEWLILFHTDCLTPGIIAHEAKHMVNFIFARKGIRLDLNNDEVECYLLSWIVNRIHELIRKNKLKIK